MRLPAFQPGPIGIDLGGRWLSAAQVRRVGARVELAAASRVRRLSPGPGRPDGRDLARLVDTLERRGFVGRRAVLAAPDDKLVASVLQLPAAAPGVPMGEIARDELAREHRKDPSLLACAWWELPATDRSEPGTPVMAVGLAHADGAAAIDAIEQAGLEVVAIDCAAMALARAAAPASPAGGLAAVVDAGWNAATIVLARDGLPIFQRRLSDLGLASLHRQVREAFDTDDEGADALLAEAGRPDGPEDVARLVGATKSALAREVAAALAYAARRFPGVEPRCVAVVGDGSAVGGLAAGVAAACELPAAVLDPASLALVPRGLAEWANASTLTAAIALAGDTLLQGRAAA